MFKKTIKTKLASKPEKSISFKSLALAMLANAFLIGLAFYNFLVLRSPMSGGSLIVLITVIDIFLFTNSKRKKQYENAKLEEDFLHLFSCFSVYVHSGIPVYSSLERTSHFAISPMANYLQTLLASIDTDKTIRPFLAFASHLESLEIREVMVSIYRMSFEGGSEDYLRQFETLFSSLASIKRRDKVIKEKESLDSLCLLPLLDSALATVLVSVGVVISMGDAFNGI